MNSLLIITGKLISLISCQLGYGNGSTWPGHIALIIEPNFIKKILEKSKTKIILIAGTNGKTTTGKLIKTILEENKYKVFQNQSGANLLNGIASSMLLRSNILGELNYDFAVFEVDENSLPLVLKDITPDYLIILNLFRDQLDRYGEVNIIADKWHSAMQNLSHRSKLILNADDPQIAYLGQKRKTNTFYFGLNTRSDVSIHHYAVDSTYCPQCDTKLHYHSVTYSHLGVWECKKCKIKRPKLDNSMSTIYPLDGIYNQYNTNAAVLLAKLNNISNATIEQSLHAFKPAFGRQEILHVDGKKVQLFLSKNPTSFNESLRTVMSKKAKHILFVLNDRIPDGRDVSWIWDVDFEEHLNDSVDVSVSGDRAYDISLRLKYAYPKVKHIDTYYPFLDRGVEAALNKVPKNEMLYILPTYSAMLEVRKILTGKKIL